MDLTEFARVFYAVNSILEKASAGVGLSKRAALALVLVSKKQTMNNRVLHDQFIDFAISSKNSAPKDSSTAKGELLKKEYIKITNNVKMFAITDSGKQAVEAINKAVGDGIDKIEPTDEQRAAMRSLVGLPPTTPPPSTPRLQRLTTGKSIPGSGESDTADKHPSKKRPK